MQLFCGKTEMKGLDRGARSAQEMHSGRLKWVVRGGDGEIIAAHSHATTAWRRAFSITWGKRQAESKGVL